MCQWTDLESPDEKVRINSELLFRKQLDWVSHMGLEYVLFPLPSPSMLDNFSRLIQDSLENLGFNAVFKFLTKPLIRVKCNEWKSWNKIRSLCNFNSKIGVALELDGNFDNWVLERWIAEPVSMLIVPTKIFRSNKSGFPVLLKVYQQFIFKILKVSVQLI